MKKLPSNDPERVARILSARRAIAVDTHALDEQVREKQQRQELEAKARCVEEQAWSARWQAVEERYAQRQAAYRARMVAYRAELCAQMDAKRRAARCDTSVSMGPGYMDGFETSHR